MIKIDLILSRLPFPLSQPSPSPSIVSGVRYSEWQRRSGLRVLQKVLDKQKLLETADGIGGRSQVLKQPPRSMDKVNTLQEEMIQVVQRLKKKPPSKLTPLGR